jgi:hypothetical protein
VVVGKGNAKKKVGIKPPLGDHVFEITFEDIPLRLRNASSTTSTSPFHPLTTTMDALLRWSIENSTPLGSAPGDRPPVQRQDLNPEIIDMILGKPDAELMKEDMAVAIDATRSEDDRINALDHLEMVCLRLVLLLERVRLTDLLHKLIEHIDNANSSCLFSAIQ